MSSLRIAHYSTVYAIGWCVEALCHISAPCGLQGCKNRPTPFPGRMSYKSLNQAQSVLYYLSMFLLCCCLLRLVVSFHWYVFCLLVVPAKLSVLAK